VARVAGPDRGTSYRTGRSPRNILPQIVLYRPPPRKGGEGGFYRFGRIFCESVARPYSSHGYCPSGGPKTVAGQGSCQLNIWAATRRSRMASHPRVTLPEPRPRAVLGPLAGMYKMWTNVDNSLFSQNNPHAIVIVAPRCLIFRQLLAWILSTGSGTRLARRGARRGLPACSLQRGRLQPCSLQRVCCMLWPAC
jgi:hypothetical protein